MKKIFYVYLATFHAKLSVVEVTSMSLKFQRDDSLDKKFEEFAFFPDEKKEEKPDIERFLNPTPKKKESDKEDK